ncbi:glycosyltransferase family 4 protein [Candidatus Enterovibrio escicola]|uniref:glycosyltransferase family 4 protein n=1 Tax=Candidatus Enterovibrio escicola TaxID=1927127 RepID=UPI001237DA9D|nr:glycosyltransferase family 4 protein [Candidatus Enterovibrio escacola]
MNILYFHQHFSTPKGSVGIRSYEMAKKAIQRGHHVTMVCGSYSGGKTGLLNDFIKGKRIGIVDGINIIEFDLSYSNNDGLVKRSFTFLQFAFKSIGLALTKDYDVLFATTTPLTAGIPGIIARWLRRKPFVFEVRDLWPELPKQMGVIKNPIILSLMSLLEWISYRSANRCIGLSPGIVDGIAARGVLRDNIELIPNGCDLSIFGSKVDTWRPEGVSETDLMAVFTGTHGVANGLDSALDAAKELQSRGRNDIKLVLVGQGKLKERLQSRASTEGLSNVIFHPPVNKEKLAGLMSSADIGLQLLANVPAFYFGTSPNKFFDYISAGLPVLNNYPGWLAGMIKEHKCGYSVEPDNSIAFADALEHAMANRVSLLPMGINARSLALQQFDRNLLSDKWVKWVTEDVK